MKRLLLIAACIVATVGALAQGTVNFVNKVGAAVPPIDAPVFNTDGTTRLSGADYLAQLYAGTSATSLAPVGSSFVFKANGYFNGGTVVVPGIAGATAAFVQVRAWAAIGGATYEAAVGAGKAAGMSDAVSVTLGNPSGTPPTVPADLAGLKSFSLAGGGGPIPEPTTIALGALAAGALLLFRRK